MKRSKFTDEQILAVESFNGKFRDECLNEHWFVSVADAKALIENWRVDYNTLRPHGEQLIELRLDRCGAFELHLQRRLQFFKNLFVSVQREHRLGYRCQQRLDERFDDPLDFDEPPFRHRARSLRGTRERIACWARDAGWSKRDGRHDRSSECSIGPRGCRR